MFYQADVQKGEKQFQNKQKGESLLLIFFNKMFKKENRLTKTKEFDNVWKNGRSSFNKILGTKIIKNNLDINRFGVLVNAKVSKKAVLRNKIKRRIREAVKERFDRLEKGFDITIIALKESKEKKFNEISVSVERNLKRLKILK